MFDLFVLEVLGCDAIETTLSFTLLRLSDHDDSRAVDSSCSDWSYCYYRCQCCNGFVFVQQALPRGGQGKFGLTTRVEGMHADMTLLRLS